MFGKAKTIRSNERRLLTRDDVDGWNKAADQRKPAMTREQIIAYVESRNSHRWWRIQHDYKWLQKQMVKMGLNPNDARELL